MLNNFHKIFFFLSKAPAESESEREEAKGVKIYTFRIVSERERVEKGGKLVKRGF